MTQNGFTAFISVDITLWNKHGFNQLIFAEFVLYSNFFVDLNSHRVMLVVFNAKSIENEQELV